MTNCTEIDEKSSNNFLPEAVQHINKLINCYS